MAKPDDKVKDAITQTKEAVAMAKAMQAEANMQTFTGPTLTERSERGVLLSSPANTQGSPLAAINAALRNNALGIEQDTPQFPEAKSLYFDSDLETLPFMVTSKPEPGTRESTFNKGTEQSYYTCDIWLLDTSAITGHYLEDGRFVPTEYHGEYQTVRAHFSGAYILRQIESFGFGGLQSRVWTVLKNEAKRVNPNGEYPRMLAEWRPTGDEIPF
jgi:hypothetical protein